MEGTFVEVGGHRIRYVDRGQGPVLVMLHGLGFHASADQFQAAIPLLEDDFRILALDQLGWGWSDRPVRDYDFPLLVDTLEGFVEAMGLDRVTLVGHTLGGWTSALLARKRPELVERLVLVNTAGLNPTAPRPAKPVQLPAPDAIRGELERTFGGSVEVTDEMVADEVARQERPDVAEAYYRMLQWVNDPQVRTDWSLVTHLGDVACPTLVIWGDDDDVLGPEFGERAVELVPDGRLVMIHEGAHIPMARKPAEFAAAVRDFLGAG